MCLSFLDQYRLLGFNEVPLPVLRCALGQNDGVLCGDKLSILRPLLEAHLS